jgi:copper(I)-binding protein
MSRFLTATALIAMLASAAVAQTAPSGVMVEHAWARATSPGAKTGAVYLTIMDHGGPDRLIGFATPVASMAQLHETTMQGDVMKMRQIDGLAVTDKGPVTLAPGGYHVMLMGLKGPLRQGETFPLSVTFEKAGTIQITVAVEAIGARGPTKSDAGHSMDMNMPAGPQPGK